MVRASQETVTSCGSWGLIDAVEVLCPTSILTLERGSALALEAAKRRQARYKRLLLSVGSSRDVTESTDAQG